MDWISESAILTVEYSLSILSLRQLRDILQTLLENKNSDQLKVSTTVRTPCYIILINSLKWDVKKNYLFVPPITIFPNPLFVQTLFRFSVDPLHHDKHKVSFKICQRIEELALVVSFIIKYKIDISGKLSVLYFK